MEGKELEDNELENNKLENNEESADASQPSAVGAAVDHVKGKNGWL